MKRKTKPPKPVRNAARRQAKDQLADLRRRLEKIDVARKAAKPDRKAQARLEPKKKHGQPPKPKPPTEVKPQPKERKMVRHRKDATGEDIELTEAPVADEPTKVYVFHLNLVTPAVPAVPATETEPEIPSIPEYTEQQAEGVRWSDRTYTIHWTAAGPAVGYLTYPSLRHLRDTYPKLTVNFVDDPNLVDPFSDDDAADLELRQRESDLAAIAAREARQRAEEAKERMELKARREASHRG